MNKTKTKPSTAEGWAVHVYDSDRHLRFTLEPSHIWAFGSGIGVGFLIAIVFSMLHAVSHNGARNTEHLTNLSPNPETSSQKDMHSEPTISLPLGID